MPRAPAIPYRRIVGAALQKLRREAGMTGAAVAAEMGLTGSTWSRIENGKSTLSVDQLHRVARVLGWPPSAVLALADNVEGRVLRGIP